MDWVLLIELTGLTYCVGRAADELGPVTVPDQLKEAIFDFALPLCAQPWCWSASHRCEGGLQMNAVIILSWVIWAVMLAKRRDSRTVWKDNWHQEFCRRQRGKAGNR